MPFLDSVIDHLTQPFEVSDFPEGFVPIEGSIHRYHPTEVNKHLSTTAAVYPVEKNRMEIYHEGERFWIVDDRWGLAELNLLKGNWRAWVLDQPSIDPYRVLEQAVLWPMAQLMRSRGLTLLPAVSVARGDWGMLLVNPFGIEQELACLMNAGFRVVGQRWTALREDEGRVSMLHVPGFVERSGPPRVRSGAEAGCESDWLDVAHARPGVTQHQAFCETVVLIESGRRPTAWVRPVGAIHAGEAIRRAWPIVELHPARRRGCITPVMGAQAKVFELRMSRSPGELLGRIDYLRYGDREENQADEPTVVPSSPAKVPTEPAKVAKLISQPIPSQVRPLRAGSISDPSPPKNLTPWSLAG